MGKRFKYDLQEYYFPASFKASSSAALPLQRP
jgi:hypothetical protein